MKNVIWQMVNENPSHLAYRSSRFTNPCLLPDRMQPVAIFWPSSGDDVEKCFLNRFGDGTARASADSAPLNFPDRHDLDSRAGQEGFIGVEQLVELQRADFDF